MINRITDEGALKDIIQLGIFPAIEDQMNACKSGDITLYSALYSIGEYVNTYHEVFQTGNSVNEEAKKR